MKGARGMYTVAVIGLLGLAAMMVMYGYTAEKLLPESSPQAKKTVDLLSHAFSVSAYATIEGDVFTLTYIVAPGPRPSESEAKAEMEKMARFVETNYPEPLSAIQVAREQAQPSGCSSSVARTELRWIPQRRPPKK